MADHAPEVLDTFPLVVVPGLYDSGPGHWQSLWQSAHPHAVRTAPWSFGEPDLDDWVTAVDTAAGSLQAPPVIVAHSLGTLTIATWLARGARDVAAVLMVAPPDPMRADFPPVAATFRNYEAVPATVPMRVVASTDDPYGSVDFAQRFAETLGAPLTLVGARGHINHDSGLGEWQQGRNLAAELLAPRY